MRRSKAPSIVRRRITPPLDAPSASACARNLQSEAAAAPPSEAAPQPLRSVQHNISRPVRRVGTPPQRPSAARRLSPARRAEVRPAATIASRSDAAQAADRTSPPLPQPALAASPAPEPATVAAESMDEEQENSPCLPFDEPTSIEPPPPAEASAIFSSVSDPTGEDSAPDGEAERPAARPAQAMSPDIGAACCTAAELQPEGAASPCPPASVHEEDMLDIASPAALRHAQHAPDVAPTAPAPGAKTATDDKLTAPAVTAEWLASAAGATLPAVMGAERLLGLWRACGTISDSDTRVDEGFTLRVHGHSIVGENCPGADEPFSIQDVKTVPAPEVHDGALAVSFLQVYTDGAQTHWQGILPDGDSVLRDGSWKGEVNGTFRAAKEQDVEHEQKAQQPLSAPQPQAQQPHAQAQHAPPHVQTQQQAPPPQRQAQKQQQGQTQQQALPQPLQPQAKQQTLSQPPQPQSQPQQQSQQQSQPQQQSQQQQTKQPQTQPQQQSQQQLQKEAKRQERLRIAQQKREAFQQRLAKEASANKAAGAAGAAGATPAQPASTAASYKPAWRELPAEIAAAIPNDTHAAAPEPKGQKRPGDDAIAKGNAAKRQARPDDIHQQGACEHAAAPAGPAASVSEAHLELVQKLNSSQQQAALSDINQPLLILAGPGSGKTATLTNRILFFLANGVHPSKILAVSFTNAAAAEMGARVKKLVKEARAKGQLPDIVSLEEEIDSDDDAVAVERKPKESNDVETSTFHSVALKIVREHANLLGLSNEFQLFGDGQQYNVVRDGLRRYRQEGSSLAGADAGTTGFNPPRRDVNNCLQELNQAKAQQKTISKTKNPELAFVSKHYAASLKDCDAIDFQDIMTKSLELMQKHPEVQKQFQEQFSHILVDEFQDTNKIQYDLMRAVVSGDRLTVVGDDDQSIFAFQGATGRDVFSNMRTDFPGIQSVRLEQNYRSTGTIVAASSAIIQKSLSRETKQAISMQKAGDPITVVNCPCAALEAHYVLEAIAFESKQAGIKLSDIAILYRKNTTGQYFQQKLLEKGIPFNHHDVCFYRRKMIKAVIFLMRIAANLKDDASFEKAFQPLLEDHGLDNAAAKRVLERTRTIADVETLSMYEAAKKVANVKISGSLNAQMLAAGRKSLRSIDLVRQRAPKSTVASLLEFTVSMFKAKEKYNLPISSHSRGKEGMLLNDSKETRTPLQVLLDDIQAFEDSRAEAKLDSQAVPTTDAAAPGGSGGAGGSMECCVELGDEDEDEDESSAAAAEEAQQAKEDQEADRMAELRAFLSYISEVENDTYKQIKSDNDNAISLLTIHRSKGLEWKIVFVIKMNEGELPMSFDQAELEKAKESQALQEERRLCFVAWSRASTRLYLTYRQQGDRTGEVLQPSRYLHDIDKKTISYVEWNPTGVALDDGGEAGGASAGLSCDPSEHFFYKQVSHENRCSVSMLFNKWSKQKAFADNPSRLVAKVKAVCIDRLAKGSKETSRSALTELMQLIKKDATQAADYGRVWSEFQKLPEDQKWERQQARQAEFQKASGDAKLAGRKASDAQVGYLRQLGCNQVPKDALEASRLITEFKKR